MTNAEMKEMAAFKEAYERLSPNSRIAFKCFIDIVAAAFIAVVRTGEAERSSEAAKGDVCLRKN